MNRKVIVLALCALFMLGLTACNEKEDQASSIAVVDMEQAQNESMVAAQALEYLENLNQTLLSEAIQAEETYQNEPTEENDVARQRAVSRFQIVMGAEQQRIFGQLEEDVIRILDEYREANGLSMIIPKGVAISVDETLDVTAGVVAELDKLELDLTLPAELEAEAMAAAADEAAADEAAAAEAAATEDAPADETEAEAAPVEEDKTDETPVEDAPASE